MGPESKPTGRSPAGVILALGAVDAAQALGISTRSFRRHVKDGRLPAGFQIGSRRLWSIVVLQSFVARQSREVTEKQPCPTR